MGVQGGEGLVHLEEDEEAASSQVSATALEALVLPGEEMVRFPREVPSPRDVVSGLGQAGKENLSIIYQAFCETWMSLLLPRQGIYGVEESKWNSGV